MFLFFIFSQDRSSQLWQEGETNKKQNFYFHKTKKNLKEMFYLSHPMKLYSLLIYSYSQGFFWQSEWRHLHWGNITLARNYQILAFQYSEKSQFSTAKINSSCQNLVRLIHFPESFLIILVGTVLLGQTCHEFRI